MSKMKKQFREKIKQNKAITEEKRNNFLEKKVVKVEIDNKIIEVDRQHLYVKSEEVQEVVKDLIYTKTPIKENSIIELDKICNVCYKMICKAIKDNKIIFSLC